ncbi:MAG: hypothetical protein Q9160_006844 [Pyrenula sp. 1 TL-2023]
MPRSEPARSGVYIIVEDVVAVDGGQGIEFRRLLDARYRWSEDIRRLTNNLDLYWGLSGLLLATLLTAAIFTIPNHDAVFVIGWTVPWIWAICSAFLTLRWTQKTLRTERTRLKQPVIKKDPWFPPTRFVPLENVRERPISGFSDVEVRFSSLIENFDLDDSRNSEGSPRFPSISLPTSALTSSSNRSSRSSSYPYSGF